MKELGISRIQLVQANEATAEAISKLNDASSMDTFLRSLSQEDVATLLNDKIGLKKLYASLIANAADEREIFAAINEQQELVGYVALKGSHSFTPEIQIEVAPSYQRKGYGYAMLIRILGDLFQNRNIEYAIYRVRPDNIQSIKLVEKVGGVLQNTGDVSDSILLKTYYIMNSEINKFKKI